MKILLLFFSGTYNTLYLATLLKNRLLNDKHEVDMHMLNKESRISFKKYDLIGIGYPIHAFNAPSFLESFLKKAKIEKKDYFIFKNSGEPFIYNDASSLKIIKILKAKQNNFIAEYHFLMPYNIMFRTKDEMISLEMSYNLKLINYLAKNLLTKRELKVSIRAKIACFIFKIQRLGAKININFYTYDKNKCIKCRKCQINCPTHNIRYDNEKHKLVFNDFCLMCMRCSFNCPTNAISIGLLNKMKLNSPYDLLSLSKKNAKYDFTKEKDKFYLKFKPYFSWIDSLVLNEKGL